VLEDRGGLVEKRLSRGPVSETILGAKMVDAAKAA
jgi:hypothetical protein